MPDEKTAADSLRWYLTGAGSDGGAQADPDASLGNFRSSTESQFLGFTVANPISNVTVDFASGENGIGSGRVLALSADTLAYMAPNGAIGAETSILNGETKVLEDGGDASKYVRVSRTSADDLAGNMDLQFVDTFNDVLGMSNITSADAAAGVDVYRAFILFNEHPSVAVTLLKVWISTLGTQQISDTAQLGASGSGTIEISGGTFSDWPETGYAHIRQSGGTTREIVYYSSRTLQVLTVPSAGRGLLGTSAGAGANDDTIDAVPGIRIASEALSGGAIQTIADENTAPVGVSWKSGITSATGVDVGTLASGGAGKIGLWVHLEIPAGAVADPSILHAMEASFDAA